MVVFINHEATMVAFESRHQRESALGKMARKVAKGNKPYGHPAIVKTVAADGCVEVWQLTSLQGETLRDKYKGFSEGQRQAKRRYVLVDHSTNDGSWDNPESEVPSVQLDNGQELARPCYINVQDTWRCEPELLAWNKVDTVVRQNDRLSAVSFSKVLQWEKEFEKAQVAFDSFTMQWPHSSGSSKTSRRGSASSSSSWGSRSGSWRRST